MTLTISAWQLLWYIFKHLDLRNIFRVTIHYRNIIENIRRNGLSSWCKTVLTQLMCIYGYSLTSFLPVTAICFIKSWVIQTVVLGIAFGFSTIFLIRGVLSLSKELGQKEKGVISIFIIGVQLILVFMYKFYFFDLWVLKSIQYHHTSFIYGCFTNITIISKGKHQNIVEFVFKVNTFLNTHFFMPLNSCLKPMLVLKFKKTINCSLG